MKRRMLLSGFGLVVPLSVAAALLLATGLIQTSDSASANQPNGGLEYTLHVGNCNTAGDQKAFCLVPSTFQVQVSLDAAPTDYDALGVTVNYTGFVAGQFENPAKGPPDIVWPDCAFEAIAPPAPGFLNAGCAIGIGAPSSSFTGIVFVATLSCTEFFQQGTISINHGPADTTIIDENGKVNTEAGPDVMNVECEHELPTNTPTPTPTPPAVPRMFKAPVLQNLFLQRQGTKIPPVRCNDSTDVATLTEQIGAPIGTLSPKGEPQSLAAFEFEVRFNWSKVCVNLRPSAQWQALIDSGDAICFVRDKDTSLLEGIAQLGCVTIAKGHQDALDGLDIAIIEVRPQPELYSQLKPNQDNGQAVQILNQGCELADEQGHAVPIFSCEDADITFRYLEGDVDGPDCDVDVLDAQQVAFRWGIGKGSLQYRGFFDLEPSWPINGDGDIDIKDVQFVFGRFGSTCDDPHPPQPPVNPKAF